MRVICLALVLSTGCATTLSTHQTAATVEPGHFEGTIGTGFYTPLGASLSAIGLGTEEADTILDALATQGTYEVTPEQRERLITAGVALATMPPSPSQELNLRTGILKNWDAGLRYSFNAIRLDTKYRVYHSDNGLEEGQRNSVDIAIGLAGSKYLFNNLVFDALEFVRMDDFSRWDLEVPLYVSAELGHIWRFYGAFKYHLSQTEFDATLVNTAAQGGTVTGLELDLPADVRTQFFGATVGMMVGYRYAWLSLELTGGYTHCRPFLLGQRRDLGGVTLYPSIGLVVRI